MVTKSELEADNKRLLSEVDRLAADLEAANSPAPKQPPAKLAEAKIAELKARVNLLEREAKALPASKIVGPVDP